MFLPMSRAFPVLCLVFGLWLAVFAPCLARAEFEDVIRELETEVAIREAMRAAAPNMLEALESAVVRVSKGTSDQAAIEAAADWYLVVLEKLRTAVEQEDPEDALRDAWIVLRQAEAALMSREMEDLYGDLRFELAKGSEDARSHIVGFARLHLTREQFHRLRNMTIAEERKRALEDPDHVGFFEFGSPTRANERQNLVGQLAQGTGTAFHVLPGSELAEGAMRQTFGLIGGAVRLPGRAVGGVTEGIGAMGGIGGLESIGQGISQMSVTLDNLPTNIRENTEILLANEDYHATLQRVDSVTESVNHVADTVGQLPEELRQTLGTFEETQPELQRTIQETDTAIRSVEAVLAQLNTTLKTAGETLEIAGTLIPPPREEPEPKEPAEPFRVESVTEAAVALEGTIAELRATLLAVHELIIEPQIPVLASSTAAESKAVVDHGVAASQRLVDHLTLRILVLVGGCLVLLLLYHVAKFLIMGQLQRARAVGAPPADDGNSQ